MPHSVACIPVHLVFSTKDRKPWLKDSVRHDLHAYLASILKAVDCPAMLINSVEDHVHILFELGRTASMSRTVEEVKKRSSKWIKTQGPEFAGFAWQAGYGVFAVCESNLTAVRKYISNQTEHHRKVSFQDEYRAFLDRHGVKYDERYLWD